MRQFRKPDSKMKPLRIFTLPMAHISCKKSGEYSAFYSRAWRHSADDCSLVQRSGGGFITNNNSFASQLSGGLCWYWSMSRLVRVVFLVFIFLVGGCFPIVLRRKKRCSTKGKCCAGGDSRSESEHSFNSIDTMSVEEPTTWKMPPKGKERRRTISGASNFSGTSHLSTLSERDRMWLQAFRFAGRWSERAEKTDLADSFCLYSGDHADSHTTMTKDFAGEIYKNAVANRTTTTKEFKGTAHRQYIYTYIYVYVLIERL